MAITFPSGSIGGGLSQPGPNQIGGNGFGLLGGGAFDYYIDSVNGSNSNSGRSPSSALKTISALPSITPSKRIGLACGSSWREQLTVSAADVTVGAYGSGVRPVLDASDIILNANFTKTAGKTNVYETPIINFIMGGTSAAWVNVFETGGPGDNATGQFLKFVADQTTVDSTAGSYTIASMSTAGGVPASGKIYIHTTDGTSPIVNGYIYEFSNRRAGLYYTAPRGRIIGIEGRKACSNSGAFALDGGDGSAFFVDGVLSRNNNDHAMFVSGGSTVQNSVFLNSYWGGNSPNHLVFYENVGVGRSFYSRNNIFQQDQNPGTAVPTCILSHAGSGMNGSLYSTNDWFIAKNGLNLIGIFAQEVSKVVIDGANASEIYQFVNVYTDLDMSNSQAVSAVASNTQIICQAGSLTLNLTTNKISTKNDAHQVGFGTNLGITVNDTAGIYYKDTPNGSALDIFAGSASSGVTALNFNGTTFDGAITFIFPYNFSGSGATFTGGTTAPAANSYKNVNRWAINGVTYSSLATWKAAVSPQDSAAINTRSGTAAQTLPPMPVVS